MAGKPWLKLWTEWIHDPKILSLGLGEKGAWGLLLSLAQECDADGYIVFGHGGPMSLEEIVRCLHITSKRDIATFESMVQKMEVYGSLTWNSGTLLVVNFAKRQSLVPSETKEAVRERVRRYRERHAVTEMPLPGSKEEESNKVEEKIEIEGEEEEEEESNGVTPVTTQINPASDVTESPLKPVQVLSKFCPSSVPNRSGKSTLSAETPIAVYYLKNLGKETLRWPNQKQKEEFEACEKEVGGIIMQKAVDWGLEEEGRNWRRIISYARGIVRKEKDGRSGKERGLSEPGKGDTWPPGITVEGED